MYNYITHTANINCTIPYTVREQKHNILYKYFI